MDLSSTTMRYAFVLQAVLLTTGIVGAAQNGPDLSKVQFKTTKLADNFYTVEGEVGSNMGILVGPDGILMVNSELAPFSQKIMAAIRQVSDQPIRFLIDTHVHQTFAGGNENFAKAGATIFARDEVRDRLIHPNRPPGVPVDYVLPAGTVLPSAPAAALPVVTYEGPVAFHMDGEDVRLIPIPRAHTDGDAMVVFSKDDIMMVGDFSPSIRYPIVDLESGGSLQGMIDGLGMIIGLAGPNTKIISGGGGRPVASRADMIAQHDMLLAIRDRVAALIAQGKTQEEILAANPTADYDAQIPNAGKAGAQFVTQVYAELKAAK